VLDRRDDRLRLVAHDDDDVVDTRGPERRDDLREEGLTGRERQQRLRSAHARGLSGGEHDGGDHTISLPMMLESPP